MADAGGLKEIFYWDGTSGCERCAEMTGWYDDLPPTPHPNCNCPHTQAYFFGLWNYEYRNKEEEQENEYESDHDDVLEWQNDSSMTIEVTLSHSWTFTAEAEVSAEIEEVFGASAKVTASETYEFSQTFTVPAHTRITVTAIGIIKTWHFAADRYLVSEGQGEGGGPYFGSEDRPGGGGALEIFDEHIEDMCDSVSGVRYDIEEEPI